MNTLRMTFFLLFFFIIPLSQAQKKFDEQSINVVCQASKDDVILALQNLSLETNSFKEKISMEQIRSVHNRLLEKMNLMFNEPRFKSLVDMKDIMLDTSSKAMKYGLCEKYRRSSASIETIAGEMYFICRKTITSGKDATPNACF